MRTETDRLAFIRDTAAAAKKVQIKAWLRANPEIGQLNGGKFYKFEAGQQVFINAPGATQV